MTEVKDALEKLRKRIAESPHPSKYRCEHMTGPEAEYVEVEARIELVGAFVKDRPQPEGKIIAVLVRILDHNIPDDAYGEASEGIVEHTRAELEANVPELEEVHFIIHPFDTVEGEDIVPGGK